MSLQAYRHLIRAARIAFEGDPVMLAGAKTSIRNGFRDKAYLSPSDPATAEYIRKAEDIASFLKRNLVQGRKEGDTYKLRIHEHTERGDNDSIKLAGKNVKWEGKCCSQ